LGGYDRVARTHFILATNETSGGSTSLATSSSKTASGPLGKFNQPQVGKTKKTTKISQRFC
jgi:hypothetical protein